MGKTYSTSKVDLAARVGCTRPILYKWMARKGFPAKTKRGWNVARCIEFIKRSKERQANGGVDTTILGTLKTDKLDLECQKLQAELDRIRRKVIPVADANRMFAMYGNKVNAVFDKWLDQVGSIMRDPKLFKSAQALVRTAKEELSRSLIDD